MTAYRVNYHEANKRLALETGATTAPAAIVGAGWKDLGTFVWTPEDNSDGYDANVVPWHFCRDILYKEGVTTTRHLVITIDNIRTLTAAALSVAVGAKASPVITKAPAQAVFDPSKAVWSSATPARATVDEKGEVTGVSAGTSIITGTYMGVTFTFTATVTEA